MATNFAGRETANVESKLIPCRKYQGKRTIHVVMSAAVVAASDLYVGPVSGPMHIAVAVGTPSVTICGGYESPRGLEHLAGVKSTTNVILSSDLPCSPCWLREPCPIGLKCLNSIAPA